MKLLEKVRPQTRAQARVTNPLGRTGHWEITSLVCQLHEKEVEIIPKGLQKGWPSVIDFDLLPARVASLRVMLAGIIDNPRRGSPIILDKVEASVHTNGFNRGETIANFRRDEHG